MGEQTGKSKIYVGNEYKSTFDSIVKMCAVKMRSEGYILQDIIDKANTKDGIISTQSQEFILTRDKDTRNTESVDAKIDNDGASWFAVFRGSAPKNHNAEWLELVEKVKQHFHKNFSLVEYAPHEDSTDQKEVEIHKQRIEEFLRLFYPDYVFEVAECKGEEKSEDIYGASLRLEITDGTGEAVPILGKVFFRKTAKQIIPFDKKEAEEISKSLLSFDKTQENFKPSQNSRALTDTVIEALDKLTKNNLSDANSTKYLDDCLVLAGETDTLTIKSMVDRGPNENVRLYCRSLTVMNISHVKWQNESYDIKLGGKTVLKAVIGIGGRLDLSCNNCKSGALLVDSGKIRFSVNRRDKILFTSFEKDNIRITFDDKDNSAITLDKILEEVKESGVFSSHIKRISCQENIRVGSSCVRYVCKDDIVELDSGARMICKCKNCPYPEVTFVCDDNVKRLTSNLAFARDKMTLVPKSNIVTCSCCGRSYCKKESENQSQKQKYVCDFCAIAKTGIKGIEYNDYAKGNKLYRKYAGMLPLSLRMRYAKNRKYCKEDEDCILFIIENSKKQNANIVYKFDKDKLGAKGFLPSPEKIEL